MKKLVGSMIFLGFFILAILIWNGWQENRSRWTEVERKEGIVLQYGTQSYSNQTRVIDDGRLLATFHEMEDRTFRIMAVNGSRVILGSYPAHDGCGPDMLMYVMRDNGAVGFGPNLRSRCFLAMASDGSSYVTFDHGERAIWLSVTPAGQDPYISLPSNYTDVAYTGVASYSPDNKKMAYVAVRPTGSDIGDVAYVVIDLETRRSTVVGTRADVPYEKYITVGTITWDGDAQIVTDQGVISIE